MVDGERSKPESGLTLLWVSMVGIALVALFVCAAALFATIEFVYRRLIAVPIAWLLSRLAHRSAATCARRSWRARGR